MLVWEKRSIYFAIGFSLREISYVLYVHVLRVRALMTRKSCAVGMRNAILRNYFKAQVSKMADEISRLKETIEQQIGNTVSRTVKDGVHSIEP